MALSAAHPDVAIGTDGWLFLKGGSNAAGLQISGRYPLAADFRYKWEALLERRAKYCRTIGAKYTYLVAPAKEAVYSGKLPEDLFVSDNRPVSDVVGAAQGRVNLIYPISEFRKAAETTALYGRQDTHWRAEGSLLAYRLVLKSLGLEPLDDGGVRMAKSTLNDLGSKIGWPDLSENAGAYPLEPRYKILVNNGVKPLGNKIVTEVPDDGLPTAVVFRDSFLSQSVFLYAQHFRHMTMLWQPNFDWSILDSIKPDFVISEQAERFLVDCPDDVTGRTNEQYVAAKLLKQAAVARKLSAAG